MIPRLDNHYFLTSSADIDGIVQPLKDFFGLSSFCYHKNLYDGSEVRLSNQPQWIRHFYEQQLYKKSVFEHTPQQYQKGHFLWASLPQHQPVLSKAREFNIDHGITFVQPQADGCEFFFIGTTTTRPEVMPRFLSHLDLLEQFLNYFREQAASILQQANQHHLVIPDKLIKTPTPLLDIVHERDTFLQLMRGRSTAQFSPREMQCIKLLLSGYSFKMIAYELQLSYRTIETHFERIKLKAGCHTKAELVRVLSKQLLR